jgi:hypothetical protein
MPRQPAPVIKYQIRWLQERHREILRRANAGQQQKKIASDLGVTPRMVSYVVNSELGKRELARMNSGTEVAYNDIRGRVGELAPKAVAVLEDALDGTMPRSGGEKDIPVPPHLQVKAAKDVLEMSGHGAPKKVEAMVAVSHLTASDLEDIKSRVIAEDKRNKEVIVDAEVIDNKGNGG